jgi:hypothetical protein
VGGVSSFSLGREELNDVVDGCLRASTKIHGVAASFESDGLGDGNAVCCRRLLKLFAKAFLWHEHKI